MQFHDMGRTLEEINSDWPAAHWDIIKSKAVWWRLGKLMRRKG